MADPVRILLAKPGLDGHDRGIKIIARAFRDAGFEVIYVGLHSTPEQIAGAAVQEDVDLVGLSCLSGAHLHLCGAVITELRDRGAGEIPIIVGGIIPDSDIASLRAGGVSEVFPPGTFVTEIVEWVMTHVAQAA